MKLGFRVRLWIFLTIIVVGLSALAWKAHSSWQQIKVMRERLSSVPSESFRLMRYYEQTVMALNNLLLSYGVNRTEQDWTDFERKGKGMGDWLEARKGLFRSDTERQCLEEISLAYTNYVEAAAHIHASVSAGLAEQKVMLAFGPFQQAGAELLSLAYKLANLHRQNILRLQTDSDRLLADVGRLLVGGVVLVLVLGSWLAVVAYRDTIAPLQLQLVESRAVIERQEKLASLGLLAAGVAHEIRNPLTAIKARLFTQKKRLQAESPERADADMIGRQIDRLERIVREVLLFARPAEPERVRVAAETPLHEVRNLLSGQLEKAGIELRLASSPPAQVHVDLQQIQQVLINLVQNAADAIGQNGTITLRARCDTRRLGDRPTEVVILEVEDTGQGIPPEVEKRLFDPFFSTREGGTGLGLSIAVRLIEKHGGALQYQTRPGQGTTFGVVLPRVHTNET